MRSNLPRELKDLVHRLATDGPHKTLETPRRVRILFHGKFIADTIRNNAAALYVWEHERYPQFYLPFEAFENCLDSGVQMSEGETIKDAKGMVLGKQIRLTVRRGENDVKVLDEMVMFDPFLQGPAAVLRCLFKVNFDAVEQWFEEDTPIHVHPKDPFKRIDVLQSNRPVRIGLEGNILAETTTSMHLYETTLPIRYYIPLTAIDQSMLRASNTRSLCPYKGEAQYHDVVLRNGKVYKDLVWYYTRPTSESAGIVNLRCFYNEKVDIWTKSSDKDPEWQLQERPVTHFA